MQYVVTRTAESFKRGDELVRDSPSYPRVMFGEAIRRARDDKGWTQAQLGDRVGLSQSKIARIEVAGTGTKVLKPAEINPILAALEVDDEVAHELRAYARAPYSERGIWVDGGSQAWWNGKLRAESLARRIWSYHMEGWDGLIQCDKYMRRMFELDNSSNIAASTRTRKARQASVYGQEPPPECQFVVSEAALYRDMGDRASLAAQLETALEFGARANVVVRILPFSAPVPTQVADFSLYQFESALITDFAVVEYPGGGVALDDEDSWRKFERRWTLVSSGAATEHDSRQMIRERLGSLRADGKELQPL